ncbi:hypothetical protein [Bradyrhizobium sp. WD16]|uniref:hypothetical protein n=1 Tax=Bradyrhizobium sp. WD16 TaxID=1521768 RepID=UPI0020A3D939|nr:hypothetical protein [Bradyrhizobium sp. WD16]UTD29057.1 hypothetical protein DB459_21305 [Bradyrhizobium sp. WD16]
MTGSIVDQLSQWLGTRRTNLVQSGIEITDRLPQLSSNVPWKGTIGLAKDDIFVSFTVWERTAYQSELIIVDGQSGKTLRSDDATPQRPEEIEAVLDSVVNDLVAGIYRRV